ncbi:TetR/AcrR family transcriptional regulator, partial [Mycolicibacterium sp. XJ1819]
MTARPDPTRSGAWGADTPVDEEDARERLLLAAEACFATRGPSRTRMSDIAQAAGVHRSTLYYYFPNKNAVLVASFVRGLTEVLKAADPCWGTSEPFLERLVQVSLVGNEAVRSSAALRMFIDEEEAARTYQAVETSALWQRTLIDALGPRLAEAAATGEVRNDVSPATLARWIARVNFSLMTEPGNPDDGGDEGILRTFLIASLRPDVAAGAAMGPSVEQINYHTDCDADIGAGARRPSRGDRGAG